ncbi:NADH-quinone oxidoreductase subunit N [Persicitalea jodogahamensis]|uniref:NADH-quinone oxidoreductase subunit N n=1 Tax=Persicitalea jodogahamensis TaxID=402147 RepID=A0A8J3G7M4_9BACT|nr:NADH-quinone oxidoreductase subunit N [Persicitalea jodogahamensis]GHB53216.1 NADH-quinone oxidoreductase subunit N [Persicitalea jodogahamensis]
MYPIILLSFLGIVVLFLGFAKSKAILLPATLLFLAVALVGNFVEWNQGTIIYFYNMLAVNNLTLAFNGIVLVSAFMIVAMTRGFQDDDEAQPAEYYAIMLFSLVGAFMMIGFENLIMLFLGLEILSVAMYVLTGSDKRNLRSNEAALKYFLMGAFATGILLFGIALLYGATGSFTLTGIQAYIGQGNPSYLLYGGLLLVLIGMLFKVSAAPFHFWTPDVYEGAPTIFTAFMATIVKTAGFAALFRLLSHSFTGIYDYWWITLAVITVLTLLVGNIIAVYQDSFKRMLAYSSISHAGYLLIALTAMTPQTENSILFYSMAYSVATICAFGVLIPLAREKAMTGKPRETYEAFNGLARNNPLLAFVLTVSMLSLAGIPLTAGFWGKFFVFGSAAERGIIWLLVVAILMSAVGIYYYFRVIMAAYMKEGDTAEIRVAPFYKIVLVTATIITLLFGIAPGLFTGLV